MISSVRLAIASVLLIFSVAVCSLSQTTSEKTPSASISGKVTIKEKGVAGIIVFAEEQNSNWNRTTLRATTDSTGSYRISNVRAGTYLVSPVANSFALEDNATNNAVVVNEGENVEDINFALVPGGVITGKITDADGKPLIEEYVNVVPVGIAMIDGRFAGNLRTDDRGIYRAFGLREGKYQVFVGQNESLGGPRPAYRQTFYPSVTDSAKATWIEVTQGSEVTNIDIVVGRPVTTFRASGRILDAETGKPLLNVKYGVSERHGEHGGSSTVGQNVTNANGEFRLENLMPGNYVVFIVPGDSGVRGDSVSFDVVDRDVSDLVINAGKAASLSGVVVFEGAGESAANKLNDLFINAWVESTEEFFGGGFAQSVNPDGSFRIGGLRKGHILFGLSSRTQGDRKPVDVVRVERDGIVQPGGLTLKDGEQVTGLRVVVKYLTGAIRGQVKVEGDELLPNSRLSIWFNPIESNPAWYRPLGNSPQLDSRRRFVIEGLAAGTYEINVSVYEPGRSDSNRIYKQQVTVTDNAVSEVTITIKTKP